LETTINGASHVIINISGDIGLIEANDAASYVQELAGDTANIIFGARYDENVQDEAVITVIATGLEEYGENSPVSSVMAGMKNKAAQAPKPQAPKPQTVQPEAVQTQDIKLDFSDIEEMNIAQKAPTYRPPVERTINIPDFLKNKR